MDAPARSARAVGGASRLGTVLRWAMLTTAAGAAGATLAPIALSPEAFAACVPPAASTVDLPCLGTAGLDLGATLGVAAGVFGALSALLRTYHERIEHRLLVKEVRSAASRGVPDRGRPAR